MRKLKNWFLIMSVIFTACNNTDVTRYVDPNIGGVSTLLTTKNPTVHRPHSMIRVFPVTKPGLGDRYLSDKIYGFAVNMPAYRMGHVTELMPTSGEVLSGYDINASSYDHDMEEVHPWYHKVLLEDSGITADWTTTERAVIYRFIFQNKESGNVIFRSRGNASFIVTGNNTIDGWEEFNNTKQYFHAEFSKPFETFGTIANGDLSAGKKEISGSSIGSYLTFNDPVAKVEVRIGISYIDEKQAKDNLYHEMNGKSFEQISDASYKIWKDILGKIQVTGGTERQKRIFYTSLYRAMERMVNISEYGRYFSGYDKKVHEDARPFYVDDYSWGNYLALHPLRVILDPEREADMLESYVRMYKESGWMPDYPRHFGDREGMFGFHSAIMFLDAYRKGIRNFEVDKAFEGMLKSAEQATMLPSRNGTKGALEDFYNEKGYYPALHPGEKETDPTVLGKPGQKRSSVAITLGHSYDAWALSEMAKELGKSDVAARFEPKAQNYRNLWNPEKGFFLPKDDKGNWIDIYPKFPFDRQYPELSSGDYYNENNGWMYLWNVQHDIKGLMELMGGEKNFTNRLDQLFTERLDRGKSSFLQKFPDQTGLIGVFGMGNQIAFFIPYLYNYTNSPWKTQRMTRLILDTWFKDNIFGVPGDEDGGCMSAFVVFSAMGFYPVEPGIPMYTITSPVFSKVTIDLHNGKTFTLVAKNSSRTNKFIQSAKLNGKVLDTPWFSHNDLINGGTLELEMGDRPSKTWGIKQ